MGNVASVIHIVNIRSLMLCKKKCSVRITKEICILFFCSAAKYCMHIIILSCAVHSCTAFYETHNLRSK